MNTVNVDFNKALGKMKPVHSVNGGVTQGIAKLTSYKRLFEDLSIPYARYHDIEYPFGAGQFIDIHCIFPNFDADENDENSYNFQCTDEYIQATVDSGTKPFYRLGESIDHSGKHFYINPPKDIEKWARICEHIIRHYNEGWANGYRHNIEYWEIWNEPEGVPTDDYYPMWTGTKEEFFVLYKVTANHLKKCFGDKIKIGGYSAISIAGCCERSKDAYDIFPNGKESMKKYYYEYFLDFISYITSKENYAPIDFFSFHKYFSGIASVLDYEASVCAIRQIMDKHGLKNAEIICTEWNVNAPKKCTDMAAAAGVSAVFVASQKSPVDMAMYYMIRSTSGYNGVITGASNINKPYYAFKSFSNLYNLGTEVYTEGGNEILYVLGAANEEKEALTITNLGVDKDIKLIYINKGIFYNCKVYITDADNDMTLISNIGYPNNKGEIYLQSTRNSIIYIEFSRD
ncbi:MAG: hypothetical protein K5768_03415 [Firmicutes bacterium]|nr:hypothetical protein [Bacillota bacterium]